MTVLLMVFFFCLQINTHWAHQSGFMVAGGGYVDCLKISYTPSVHHHNFTPCIVWLINLVLIYLVYDSQKEPLSGMGYFTKQDQFIVNFKLIFACNITCFLKSICIDLFKTPVQSANTNSFTCRSSLLLSNNYIVLIDYKTFSRSNHPSAQLPSLFVTTIAMVKRNKAKTHLDIRNAGTYLVSHSTPNLPALIDAAILHKNTIIAHDPGYPLYCHLPKLLSCHRCRCKRAKSVKAYLCTRYRNSYLSLHQKIFTYQQHHCE